MSFEEDYPFGIKSITVHVDETPRRVRIDPNDPRSVYEGLSDLVGRPGVTQLVIVRNDPPELKLWRAAAANGETLKSFDEWKEEQK